MTSRELLAAWTRARREELRCWQRLQSACTSGQADPHTQLLWAVARKQGEIAEDALHEQMRINRGASLAAHRSQGYRVDSGPTTSHQTPK